MTDRDILKHGRFLPLICALLLAGCQLAHRGGEPASERAQPLIIHPARDYYPAWSPDGQWIAFTSDRSGNGDIWLADRDGQRVLPLTADPAYDGFPAWSPDGRRIAFYSTRLGSYDIWVMDSDGGNQQPLTTDPATDLHPTWSPDGRRIAFLSNRTGRHALWVMAADGSGQRLWTDGRGGVWMPAWSPDGQWIALESGIGTSLIPPDPGFAMFQSPLHGRLWLFSPDGGPLSPLLREGGSNDWAAVWSPDGQWIAFTSDRSGNLDLWAVRSNGTGLRRLTKHPAADALAAWSPDGRRIAFVSNRSGNLDIWIIPWQS